MIELVALRRLAAAADPTASYTSFQRAWLRSTARMALDHVAGCDAQSSGLALRARMDRLVIDYSLATDEAAVYEDVVEDIDPLLVSAVPWSKDRAAETWAMLRNDPNLLVGFEVDRADGVMPSEYGSAETGCVYRLTNGNHRITRRQITGGMLRASVTRYPDQCFPAPAGLKIRTWELTDGGFTFSAETPGGWQSCESISEDATELYVSLGAELVDLTFRMPVRQRRWWHRLLGG